MLFLRGAEFTWFFSMWAPWLVTGVLLMVIYFLLDTYYYKREHWTALSADHREHTPLQIEGNVNFVYLLGVVLTVAFVNEGIIPEMGDAHAPMWLKYMREIVLVSLTLLSLYSTKNKVRFVKNKFSWAPIIEVAVLFLGIFTTMTPALAYLNTNAELLGLDKTWQFYYASGALSSFLDNTPTAVAFHSVASGLDPNQLAAFGEGMMAGIPVILLKAICMGSVFFGAMTYIGNGPNFMVKAIAEENGVKMPSFFGYMFKFSLIVLLPIYILVQLIFL
jgi:Na+/H+ antiporter NhaD/arsenite permease-like protein